MRQNPKWILLSEIRHAEAVLAVRNSISSGHNIITTIHADKAESIPSRMYSLLETNIDLEQFLLTIHRYVHIGVHIKAHQDPETKKMKREVAEVVEFYVDKDNKARTNIIYKKDPEGKVLRNEPSQYLLDYIASQGEDLNTPVEDKINISEIKPQQTVINNEIKEENKVVQPEPIINSQSESIISNQQPVAPSQLERSPELEAQTQVQTIDDLMG